MKEVRSLSTKNRTSIKWVSRKDFGPARFHPAILMSKRKRANGKINKNGKIK